MVYRYLDLLAYLETRPAQQSRLWDLPETNGGEKKKGDTVPLSPQSNYPVKLVADENFRETWTLLVLT